MQSIYKKYSNNRATLIILFFLSPILSLVYALRNYKNKNYHIIILMFAFLFGYSFIPYEGSDTQRYQEFYLLVSSYNFTDFLNDIANIYTLGSRFQDAYLIVLMYVCSLFGMSYKVFVGVQAVIYFSLFIGIINTILENVRENDTSKYLVFLLGCVFIYSFASGVNNIRFQTAFMVFMFFALKHIFSKQNKYLILAGLSIFVHLAIAQVFFSLILFYFLNRFQNNFIKLIIIAVFGTMLFGLTIQEVSEFIGSDVVSEKVEGYTNENFIETREEIVQKWNWYLQINQYASYYFLIIVLFLTKYNSRHLKTNPTLNRLFLFSLILFVISFYNELFLDTISNRYRKFFEFISLVYLIIFFASNKKSTFTKLIKNFYTVILLITILISLRSLSFNLDVVRLTLSPLINLIEFDSVNIYDLI